MDEIFYDEIDRDLLENGPGESPFIRLAKAEQQVRELTAANRTLKAALEAKHQQYTGAVIQLTEERDNLMPRMLEWRGVETPCKRCGGSGRIGYANTATWRGGIGGSMMTADVCNGCWGTGDEHRKGVDLRKVSFEDTRALRVELAEARKDGERYRYIRTEAMIDYCTGTKRHNRISWPTIYAAAPVDGGDYRDRFDDAIDAARGTR